ncbi:uncharacterized protein [Gossypium hirsutum]|uniref:Retrotransposon gag domain-containing protein n=1 Tax=Gossypium hirsutum TaxID=3635 RepID=A0A1U8L8T5_GOSHI|nr:uncharacterized protein LOC107924653 [Gossypium hirsutum]
MIDINYKPNQKLKGDVSLLRDEAYQWWLMVEQYAQPEQVNWDYFKNVFQSKYMGPSYIKTHGHEFINLVQGDRSVAEYEAKFLKLSRYARVLVVFDYDKCVRFKEGLRYDLWVLIAPQKEQAFAALVDKAKIVEEIKPPKIDVSAEVTEIQLCRDYGKHHPGECWRKFGACLRCGSMEYRARYYPCRPNQPLRVVQQQPKGCGIVKGGNGYGRGQRAPSRGAGQTEAQQFVLVYAARCLKDSDDDDVIAGVFFIYFVLYFALIDIGSTHSYIASTVSANLGISVKNTAKEFSAVSLLVDLMKFLLDEFDLILGMDWLVKYRVSLDCASKRVTLKTDENSEVVMVGECRDYLSNVISAPVVDKLIWKGCELYLAFTSDYVLVKLSVGDFVL